MIGFDFDGTLSNPNFFKMAKEMVIEKECLIITSRCIKDIDDFVKETADILNISRDMIFAIGDDMPKPFNSKADFIKHKGFDMELFFDDDPWEIMALQKIGIPALWVTPDADSIMGELSESFVAENHMEKVNVI